MFNCTCSKYSMYCNRCVFSQIVLSDSHPVQLQGCQCTCVAGTAFFNHVAALLYQTAHYSQRNTPPHLCSPNTQLHRNGTEVA